MRPRKTGEHFRFEGAAIFFVVLFHERLSRCTLRYSSLLSLSLPPSLSRSRCRPRSLAVFPSFSHSTLSRRSGTRLHGKALSLSLSFSLSLSPPRIYCFPRRAPTERLCLETLKRKGCDFAVPVISKASSTKNQTGDEFADLFRIGLLAVAPPVAPWAPESPCCFHVRIRAQHGRN